LRDRGAFNPGSLAQIIGERAAVHDKRCAICGCEIPKRKTYCAPCYDVRLMSQIKKNRKYRKKD